MIQLWNISKLFSILGMHDSHHPMISHDPKRPAMVFLQPPFQKLAAIAHEMLLDFALGELKGASGIDQGILAELAGTEPENEDDDDEAANERRCISSVGEVANPSSDLGVFHAHYRTRWDPFLSFLFITWCVCSLSSSLLIRTQLVQPQNGLDFRAFHFPLSLTRIRSGNDKSTKHMGAV